MSQFAFVAGGGEVEPGRRLVERVVEDAVGVRVAVRAAGDAARRRTAALTVGGRRGQNGRHGPRLPGGFAASEGSRVCGFAGLRVCGFAGSPVVSVSVGGGGGGGRVFLVAARLVRWPGGERLSIGSPVRRLRVRAAAAAAASSSSAASAASSPPQAPSPPECYRVRR